LRENLLCLVSAPRGGDFLGQVMSQVLLHGIPGQPEIGGNRVEAPHHLGLGHDRQAGQV
jgi:hypothetical protein